MGVAGVQIFPVPVFSYTRGLERRETHRRADKSTLLLCGNLPGPSFSLLCEAFLPKLQRRLQNIQSANAVVVARGGHAAAVSGQW